MAETDTKNALETEHLGKLIIKYAVPSVIAMVVAALYNIVDQLFISNAAYLGSNGNAANTAVFPMTVIAIAIAVMIGNGCCTFVSLHLGKKNNSSAASGVGNAVISVIAVSLVLTAVYLIFANPILKLFGADVNGETFEFSKEYFFYITLGIPFYMFGQAMNPIIRADGSPRYAMATLLIGAGINVIFDPICIYVLKWGMTGAALATIAGQIVSAVLGIIYLFRMKQTPLDRSCFKFIPKMTFKIWSLGVSDFFAQISIVFSMLVTNNMANKYGAMDEIFSQAQYAQIPLTIAGIVSKFFQITISISAGLAAGCMPIASYNLGAGNTERVRGLTKWMLVIQAIMGLISSIIFLTLPVQLMTLFGAGHESTYYLDFGVWFIRGQLCLLPLACVNKGYSIYLQSLDRAKAASVLAVLREFIFGIGFALLLPTLFGLYALPFFMPAADICSFIAVIAVYLHTDKSLKKNTVPRPQPTSDLI